MIKTNLNGTWHMEGAGYRCDGMIPGSVYSFLMANGLMDDPHYRDRDWQYCKLLENEFTFSRTFNFENNTDAPVLLCCEGLDTLCNLYLNDHLVAYTDNMHRSYEFDVTDLLRNGENRIRAEFLSPNLYIKNKQKQEYLACFNTESLDGYSHIRKAHCMMGWDWGPRLPDAGIWKDIYLLEMNSDRLTDVHILQEHENGEVYVTAQVTSEKGKGRVSVTATAPDGSWFEMAANVRTKIEKPMLWWPHGYGEQNLYTFAVRLLENDTVVDEKTLRVGLREMKLIREKDKYGESFCHEVNGVRVFAMGADYIPEDNILTRITPARTRKLLEQCVSCNFNAIRIWGGGFYPHDYFFDICDELGLLVFEDMMFACMEVTSDEDQHENIAVEVRQNLIRMRHHACIAVISGNNEVEEQIRDIPERRMAYLRVFEDLIPSVLKEVCPYIPYVPSSPSSCGHFVDPQNENYGDSHYWKVWHGGLPFAEYRKHYFRYLSEFGFESFPSEKTMNAVTAPEDRNIFSRVMELHQRCQGANGKILRYLADTFLYPTEYGTLLYASQLLQAEAIRYAVEHLRRNRGRCMGALYWQLNDIWPVASWASIDYYGRYKALQYVAKRFFAPVMISCHEIGETTTRPYVIMEPEFIDYSTEARLCVANETTDAVNGTVFWQLRTAAGGVLQEGAENVTVPALTSLWLDNMDFHKTDVEHNYLSFRFAVDGETVSEGSVLFTAPKHFLFENPKLRCEINGDEITVYADAYAKNVEIDSPDSDFILSDNYFDMDPGKKTVKILEGTPKTVRLRSVYDIR